MCIRDSVNLKSSVKLSHVNMYHCESPASNIFPGHPYSKIIFIQKGQGQFYFGNQFLPVRENDLLLVNPDKQKFSVDVRESPLDFVILGIENLSFIDDTKTVSYTHLDVYKRQHKNTRHSSYSPS